MKKTKILTLLIFAFIYLSCSNESSNDNSSPSVNGEVENLNFTFKNQKFTVTYLKNVITEENTPIENDAFHYLNKINDKFESLITYVLDDYNFILFENNEELSLYLKKKVSLNKNTSTQFNEPYDNPFSLRIYGNSNFDNEIFWHSSFPPIYSSNPFNSPTPIPNGCYYEYGTNSERLKNFSDTSMWKIFEGNILVVCGSNEFIGNKPNDRVSSISVSGCYARCYEDANYGGRSFVLDARNSGILQISNLKNLYRASWGRNWNDNISSIQLTY